MRWAVAVLIAAAGGAATAAEPWTPSYAVRHAWGDVRTLPSRQQQHTRYLDLGHIPAVDRPVLIQVLTGHGNGLNREVDKAFPAIVPGTKGSLLRLNIRRYGWKRETWESLKDADKFYHTQVTTTQTLWWPGGTWPADGKFYEKRAFQFDRKTTVVALSPILSSEGVGALPRLLELAALTNSEAPIVRGDWFLWQTAVQELRNPGYYDFLQVANQKDFEKLIRFNAETAKDLEHRRNLFFSKIVSGYLRRIERFETALGGGWRTFDSAIAQGRKNPIRNLDDRDFDHEAERWISQVPCGMPVFYLGDDKGKRQNKAPDNVVGGNVHNRGPSTVLHIGHGCTTCHFFKGEDCIKDFTPARLVGLYADDEDKLYQLQRQYRRKLAPAIKRDRERFAEAITEGTAGLTTEEWGQEYGRWYSWVDDAKIDAERMARELGVTEAKMLGNFRALARLHLLDEVLTEVLNGGSVPNYAWQEIFATAAANSRGYVLTVDGKWRKP